MSFVNYAHRGASEYAPENTMMAFYLGLWMGANGIETDVQITKDGVPVLFHDDTLERVTGEKGSIQDYTYEELHAFHVQKNGHTDKIVKFEDFLRAFAFRDITFAIELKQKGTAKVVADLLRVFNMQTKTIVTSFNFEELCDMRLYAPEFRTGYLTDSAGDTLLSEMKEKGIEELCPKAEHITAEKVLVWKERGFSVRAWGVSNTELMRKAYDAGVDGMTVNFPDKLTAYRNQKGEME